MKKILFILVILPIFGYAKDLKISKQIGFDGKNIIYKDTCFTIEYYCDKIKIDNKVYSVKREFFIDDGELITDIYKNKNIMLVIKLDMVNSKVLQVEIWKKPFDYVQIFRL